MLFDPSNLVLEPQPRKSDVQFAWSIVRTPTDGRSLSLVVVSARVFGIRTHYYRRRTTPHLAHDCPACRDGGLSRWTGYLLAAEWPAIRPVIFEFTPKAAESLFGISERVGSLRGSQIIASRHQKRANGQVRIDYKGEYRGQGKLPEDQDVLPILLHIWGLCDREGNIREQPGRAGMTPAEEAEARAASLEKHRPRASRRNRSDEPEKIGEMIDEAAKKNGAPLPGQLNYLERD